jgi:hypothetical protein
LTKKGWATFWAIFFTNSSGHSAGSKKMAGNGPDVHMLNWTQSYDRELQRQRCKNLQHYEKCILKTKIFSSAFKNVPAHYSVVVVNKSAIGLAPEARF